MIVACAIPVAGLYVFASICAAVESIRGSVAARRLALRSFYLGAFVHSVYLAVLAWRHGTYEPGAVWLQLTIVSWVIALIYVVLLRNRRWVHYAGTFIPLIFLIFFAGMARQPALMIEAPRTVWWAIPQNVMQWHLSAAFLSIAICLVAGVIGVLYLLKARQLKSRALDARTLYSPALPTVERSLSRALVVGFLALTLTTASGLWLHRSHSLGLHGWLSLAAWFIYGVVLHGRWKRLRHASQWITLSLVGLAAMLLSFAEAHGL